MKTMFGRSPSIRGSPYEATTLAGDIQYGDPASLSSPSNVRQ